MYNDGMDRMNVGPGHMYTYLTAIFLCDSCDADVIRTVKKTRIYKSFHFHCMVGWIIIMLLPFLMIPLSTVTFPESHQRNL